MGSPLRGLRVIDVADESAVFATRLLADLGAEVVRVEPPGGGRVRSLAPFLADHPGVERSLQHLYHNAGKQSVVIDRSTTEGRERFLALVATADALVETERLDHDELRAVNPALVHATVTPFGLDAEWSDWKGNDLIASAAGGVAYVSGSPEDPPNQPGADQAYKMAGLAAAAGVVIALTGRERRAGRPGVHLDISVQAAVALTALQTSNPSHWVWNKRVPQRPGMTAVHKCADGGWITLNVRPNRMEVFEQWVGEAGVTVSDDNGEQSDVAAFGAARRTALLVREMAAKFPRDEFMKKAHELDLMGLPVQELPELDTCEQLAAIEEFLPVAHDTLGATLRFPRSPVNGTLRRAPSLGEHNETLESLAPGNGALTTPAYAHFDLGRALDGIRVVDFCWMIAGPLGTRLLANFGAEVIRVEAGRRAYPDNFPEGYDDPTLGAFHNILNTQKKSITIDPRTPDGRELLLELIASADIVTNNYRPQAMEELGFGYDVLRKVNPRIVSLAMPGSGSQGPWARLASYGNMVSAAAGLSFLTGFPGRSPRGMGVAYPDFSCPYLLPIMVLAALRERDRTGEGLDLELNQLAATVSFLGVEWLQYDSTGTAPPMRANRDPNWCPHGVYPAAGDDEWIAVAVGDDHDFGRLCDVLGRSELVADSRFWDHTARKANEDALDAVVQEWTASRDKWEASALLQSHGVAAAPVEHLGDTLERDPQLSRHHYQRVVQPPFPDVEIVTQGEVIQQAGHRRPVGRAPVYGEHTDEILELLRHMRQ